MTAAPQAPSWLDVIAATSGVIGDTVRTAKVAGIVEGDPAVHAMLLDTIRKMGQSIVAMTDRAEDGREPLPDDATRLTAGRLRAFLALYPEDTPVRFAVPDPDDDGLMDNAFAATAVGFGSARYGDDRGTVPDTFLTVDLVATDVNPYGELMNYAQPVMTTTPGEAQ